MNGMYLFADSQFKWVSTSRLKEQEITQNIKFGSFMNDSFGIVKAGFLNNRKLNPKDIVINGILLWKERD